MIKISNKGYGIKFERSERKYLEKLNMLVFRSSASLKDFDIIAIKKDRLLLEQIKSTKQKYYSYRKEIEEIRKFDNAPTGTICRLIIYHRGRRIVGYEKIL